MNTADLLPYLTAQERDRILAIENAPAPLWAPNPGPQMMAYESKADVIGYGGAAGGGKTDLAIGLAINRHPRTVIFRRSFDELKAINERIANICGGWEGHSGQLKTWRPPVLGGRQIDYASIQLMGNPETGPRDERDHQGRPHSLIVFDETVNFSEYTVRFLSGWNRHEDPSVHCQILMPMNPPMDVAGLWVIRYFAPWLDPKYPRPAVSGELRWFVYDPAANGGAGAEIEVDGPGPVMIEDQPVQPKSRTFIFSSVSDNPYYRGSGYEATLQALPEPMRSRLLKGLFLGNLKDHALQVIPADWVRAAQARWSKPARLPTMDSVGVDVARGGKDKTVIAARHVGNWFAEPARHPGTDTPNGSTTAALVLAELRDRAPVHIDVVGVGSSPYDKLVELGFQTLGINGAEKAPGPDRTGRLKFFNYRSWMWWRMRDLLDPQANAGAALPPGDDILEELSTPRWSLRGATIYVESREDIIERLGHSPDVATALCLAAIETPRYADIAGTPDDARRNYDPIAAMRGFAPAANARRDYNPLG